MPPKLSPVPNPASYPTRQQALGRRLVLGGIGAATLLGSACFFQTAGEPPIVPGPDASVIQDAGPADAGPRDAAQPSDAEMLGGVAAPEDGGK